jgi:hypothetical protein
MNERSVYRMLRLANDIRAVRRGYEGRSSRPIVRRIGRRLYGRLAGQLARRLFG